MHLIRVTLKGADVIRFVLEMEKIGAFTELSNCWDGISWENIW